MVPFNYDSLDVDFSQKPIRLFKLLPGHSDAVISFQLVHASLLDKPSYEALSYCWGDKSDPVTIFWDTGTVEITRNLYLGLLRLRNKLEVRTLWIDAICINQMDDLERGQQVRQMADVYRSATRTLIWLGPGNKHTEMAFNLVPYLLNAYIAFGGQPQFFSPHLSRRATHPVFGELQGQRQLYEPFRQLDLLPYFSRVWVIQELAISGEKALFFCGTYEISCKSLLFAFATFQLLSLGKGTPRKPYGPLLQILTTSFVDMGQNQLISLVDEYREKRCSDPRDKIYGFIGMADPKDVTALGIEVNYELTTSKLYTQLARATLVKDNNFKIFGYLGCKPRQTELPSWVPDWTIEEIVPLRLDASVHVKKNSAGGNFNLVMAFSPNGSALITQGMIVLKIIRAGLTVGPDSRGKILQDWEIILAQAGGENYPTGCSAIDAFVSTVLTGHPKFAVTYAKKLFLLWYLKIKAQHPDSFSSGPKIFESEAETQNLRLEDENALQDNEREELLGWFGLTEGRRFAITEKNYFAFVPNCANEGDRVALLKGGEYPIVMRAMEAEWKIIGECYIHGVMYGELFKEHECEEIKII